MPTTSQFQPDPSATQLVGTISQWEDAKGCGWVKSGGSRVFLHIKEFERVERRPQPGDEVRFIPGLDPKGRDCAKRVRFVKTGGRVGLGGWVWLCCLLVPPGLAARMLPLPLWVVPTVMVVMSMITFWMYAHDKQQAVAARWRVAEKSLHLAELLGGWPGAFLAQRRLRHKCRKGSYQAGFWMIVLIHQIAAADVLSDHRLSAMAVDRVDQVIRRVGTVEKPSSPPDYSKPGIYKIRKSPKRPPHQ